MMNTIQEVKEHYEVDNHGIISSFGKFEGEMPWVVLAYESYLDGNGIEYYSELMERVECSIFDIDSETRHQWQLETETVGVAIYYHHDGFISGQEMNEEEYGEFMEMVLNPQLAMDCYA